MGCGDNRVELIDHRKGPATPSAHAEQVVLGKKIGPVDIQCALAVMGDFPRI